MLRMDTVILRQDRDHDMRETKRNIKVTSASTY